MQRVIWGEPGPGKSELRAYYGRRYFLHRFEVVNYRTNVVHDFLLRRSDTRHKNWFAQTSWKHKGYAHRVICLGHLTIDTTVYTQPDPGDLAAGWSERIVWSSANRLYDRFGRGLAWYSRKR